MYSKIKSTTTVSKHFSTQVSCNQTRFFTPIDIKSKQFELNVLIEARNHHKQNFEKTLFIYDKKIEALKQQIENLNPQTIALYSQMFLNAIEKAKSDGKRNFSIGPAYEFNTEVLNFFAPILSTYNIIYTLKQKSGQDETYFFLDIAIPESLSNIDYTTTQCYFPDKPYYNWHKDFHNWLKDFHTNITSIYEKYNKEFECDNILNGYFGLGS